MKVSLKHIPERTKLLLLSLMVGVLSGCAAVILDWTIHAVRQLLDRGFPTGGYDWQYLILPGIGMLISLLLVRYLVRDNIGHGVTKVLLAVSRGDSKIKPHNMWSSMLTSSITIGFGGSVGAEAPIVYTGAAIGSNIGRYFGLSYRNITLLLGCGAAGAVAGIFKAPLAGVLFTLEILLFNVSMTSLLPLLVSTISATVVSYIFRGQTPVFACTLTPFSMGNIPFYIILGVFGGLGSLYFMRTTLRLEDRIGKIANVYVRWAVCAAALGLLIFLFPPLYGEGYDVIRQLINGDCMTAIVNSPLSQFLSFNPQLVLVGYFVAIILLKIVASVATNGAGGVGGIFAPSLFMGAIVGFVTARLMSMLGLSVSEANFALVGMAGLMSGVMHAPLTGIFLIAELTGGYHLFMPLMIVSVISYLTIMLFEPHSLYAMRLAQKGELLTHNKDRNVLTLLKMDSVLETDFITIFPEMTLGQLVKVISTSNRNVFPVVDNDGHLRGILLLDEVRNIMFQPRLYKRFTVEQLMTSPAAVLRSDMPMEKVMETFEDTGAWNLPVVDEERKYLGFVSKSKIFNSYRHVLVHFSEE